MGNRAKQAVYKDETKKANKREETLTFFGD